MDVRGDFPILDRLVNGRKLVYFDNAATTQKPVQVIEAVKEFYEKHNANPGRGVHTLAVEVTEMYENARRKIARFINAKPEEIVFTHNATQSLNMAAGYCCRDLGKFDRVVATIMEHHSNYTPLAMAAKRTGAELAVVDMDDDGRLDLRDYEKKVNINTKAIAATHVSNVLGTVNPVSEMARIAHDSGALFILDGAQSVPHMKTDVKKLECDFLAFSGHKMLGPMGAGVLYGRYDLLEDMKPLFTGGGMISRVYPGDIEFLDPPQRFEAGTQNVAGVVGLGAAIDYLEKIGMKRVRKHEEELTTYTLDNIADVEMYGSHKRIGIISFNIRNMDPHDLAMIMDENGVAIRSGHHCAQPLMHRLRIDGCARMSFYIYNTIDEVDYALGVIKKARSLT